MSTPGTIIGQLLANLTRDSLSRYNSCEYLSFEFDFDLKTHVVVYVSHLRSFVQSLGSPNIWRKNSKDSFVLAHILSEITDLLAKRCLLKNASVRSNLMPLVACAWDDSNALVLLQHPSLNTPSLLQKGWYRSLFL
jgi:hypothetical protein